MNTDVLKWKTLNVSQGSWWVDTPHYTHKSKAPVKIILTLSFEFPNNYSQKRVLWRNMPPPNRHGSPRKIVIKNIFGCPSESEPVLRQVPAGANEKQKGLPVFFVTSQSSSEENLPASALAFPPPTPRVSLISTPTRPRWSASQRLPCAPRRCVAEKKGVGKRQFHQHFTVAPRKRRVCVRSYCCERKTDGLRDQWLGAWRRRRWEGKNPHGCADKAAGEREREGQGRLGTHYSCNVFRGRLLELCFWGVAITRSNCLATQFQA